jgi:hypothetical protein
MRVFVSVHSNAASNDIAVANFDPGVGLGVNMFVGQFDPNTQFTGDPGDFYFNMSPVDDDDVLWVKGSNRRVWYQCWLGASTNREHLRLRQLGLLMEIVELIQM